jgi:hypothetical protein
MDKFWLSVTEIGSSVATPLALAGFVLAVFFLIVKLILGQFNPSKNFPWFLFLKDLVDKFFVLALVGMVFGFLGYIVPLLRPLFVGNSSTNQPVYKTCALPEFGRIGWVNTETVENGSGWVDGGNSQPWWCEKLKQQFVTGRSLGPDHEAVVLSSSEESDKDFFGHVTYNYICKIKFSWTSIYESRQDPRCG